MFQMFSEYFCCEMIQTSIKKYNKPTKELFPKFLSSIGFIEAKISKKSCFSQHLTTNETERKVNSKVKQL